MPRDLSFGTKWFKCINGSRKKHTKPLSPHDRVLSMNGQTHFRTFVCNAYYAGNFSCHSANAEWMGWLARWDRYYASERYNPMPHVLGIFYILFCKEIGRGPALLFAVVLICIFVKCGYFDGDSCKMLVFSFVFRSPCPPNDTLYIHTAPVTWFGFLIK